MSLLPVQKFLLTHTFADLEKQHGVEASLDSRNGHKFSLNYSQIDSREDDVLSQQCRGLILSNGSSLWERARYTGRRGDEWDISNICPGSTQVIAAPMFRFFNAGQGAAAPVNWNDPKLALLKKMDGSLIIIYMDQIIHEWHVSTRSVTEANVPLDNGVFTFRTLFEKTLNDTYNISFKDFCKKLDPDVTYCFELTSPYNPIVCRYSECRLWFLAARNKITHKEIEPSTLTYVTKLIPTAPTYDVIPLDQLVDFVGKFDPLENEGVVVRDSNFNRLKVKNPAYVAYSKCHDSLKTSDRNAMELILLEKDDDVVAVMPEAIAERLKLMKAKYVNFLDGFDDKYKSVCLTAALRRETDPMVQEWNDRKLFSKCVKDADVWSSPCYEIYSGKCKDIKEYVKNCKKMGTWTNNFIDLLFEEIGYEPIFKK